MKKKKYQFQPVYVVVYDTHASLITSFIKTVDGYKLASKAMPLCFSCFMGFMIDWAINKGMPKNILEEIIDKASAYKIYNDLHSSVAWIKLEEAYDGSIRIIIEDADDVVNRKADKKDFASKYIGLSQEIIDNYDISDIDKKEK